MDSLPEQHIEKLPTATRDDAYSKIGKVFLLRRDGSEPEDEVAHRAGFGSAAAMHHQLRVWGLAGLLPPEDEEQPQKARAPKGGGERKGRGGGKGGGGKAQELPAAADAGGLFRSAIDRLKSDRAC
jgi:hypothetical protein